MSTQAQLARLVAFPTVTSDKQANKRALDYIEQYVAARGLLTERFEQDGYGSLIAATRSLKRPAILLNAHIDTAPAPSALLALQERDGKLYGRGVFDMKFAIAAYLQLVDDIKDRLDEYDFGIMITSDEEYGGFHGAGALAAAGYVPKHVCITPDGGDNWALETTAKGVWHIRITTAGKAAHGSRPWEGENAIDQLVQLLEKMKSLFSPFDTATNHSTMTVSTLHAGNTVNQIPDAAVAELDIRTANVLDHARLQREIRALCERADATCETIAEGQPCVNELDNPFIKEFARISAAVTGQPIATATSFAASDARHWNALGVPCIIFRPPGGGHHGDDEWIAKESLAQLTAILHDYLNIFARSEQVAPQLVAAS